MTATSLYLGLGAEWRTEAILGEILCELYSIVSQPYCVSALSNNAEGFIGTYVVCMMRRA